MGHCHILVSRAHSNIVGAQSMLNECWLHVFTFIYSLRPGPGLACPSSLSINSCFISFCVFISLQQGLLVLSAPVATWWRGPFSRQKGVWVLLCPPHPGGSGSLHAPKPQDRVVAGTSLVFREPSTGHSWYHLPGSPSALPSSTQSLCLDICLLSCNTSSWFMLMASVLFTLPGL